jgi:hypothetical protein
MRADSGKGGTVDPGPWAGHPCESCGRQRATEALQRRSSRRAEITKQRIDHQVLLCYQCWLDILCGLKPMPPEHAEDGNDRLAFARGARAVCSHAALSRQRRACRRGVPSGPRPDAAAYSAAFLRLRSAREALREAHAHGFPARQERADFHEALAAVRHRAAAVRRRARRLGAPAGVES